MDTDKYCIVDYSNTAKDLLLSSAEQFTLFALFLSWSHDSFRIFGHRLLDIQNFLSR